MKRPNQKGFSFPQLGLRRRPRNCRGIRHSFATVVAHRLGPDATWIQRHLTTCPRCRQRLAAWHRVELALSATKSQPHPLNLLARANADTVRMLSRDLRNRPQAHALAETQAEPSFLDRSVNYRHWATNVAACLVIVFLAKSGLFSSLDRLSAGSEKIVRQYYTNQVGDDLAGELFDA